MRRLGGPRRGARSLQQQAEQNAEPLSPAVQYKLFRQNQGRVRTAQDQYHRHLYNTFIPRSTFIIVIMLILSDAMRRMLGPAQGSLLNLLTYIFAVGALYKLPAFFATCHEADMITSEAALEQASVRELQQQENKISQALTAIQQQETRYLKWEIGTLIAVPLAEKLFYQYICYLIGKQQGIVAEMRQLMDNIEQNSLLKSAFKQIDKLWQLINQMQESINRQSGINSTLALSQKALGIIKQDVQALLPDRTMADILSKRSLLKSIQENVNPLLRSIINHQGQVTKGMFYLHLSLMMHAFVKYFSMWMIMFVLASVFRKSQAWSVDYLERSTMAKQSNWLSQIISDLFKEGLTWKQDKKYPNQFVLTAKNISVLIQKGEIIELTPAQYLPDLVRYFSPYCKMAVTDDHVLVIISPQFNARNIEQHRRRVQQILMSRALMQRYLLRQEACLERIANHTIVTRVEIIDEIPTVVFAFESTDSEIISKLVGAGFLHATIEMWETEVRVKGICLTILPQYIVDPSAVSALPPPRTRSPIAEPKEPKIKTRALTNPEVGLAPQPSHQIMRHQWQVDSETITLEWSSIKNCTSRAFPVADSYTQLGYRCFFLSAALYYAYQNRILLPEQIDLIAFLRTAQVVGSGGSGVKVVDRKEKETCARNYPAIFKGKHRASTWRLLASRVARDDHGVELYELNKFIQRH